MKKIYLLLLLPLIMSCSGSDDDYNSPNPPAHVYQDLKGAVFYGSPSFFRSFQSVYFEIIKDDEFLKNEDYTWSLSDTLIGEISNGGRFYSKKIGTTVLTVTDKEGNSINKKIKVDAYVSDDFIPRIPIFKKGISVKEIRKTMNEQYPEWKFDESKSGLESSVYNKGGLYSIRISDNGGTISFRGIGKNYFRYEDISTFSTYLGERYYSVSNNINDYHWEFDSPVEEGRKMKIEIYGEYVYDNVKSIFLLYRFIN